MGGNEIELGLFFRNFSIPRVTYIRRYSIRLFDRLSRLRSRTSYFGVDGFRHFTRICFPQFFFSPLLRMHKAKRYITYTCISILYIHAHAYIPAVGVNVPAANERVSIFDRIYIFIALSHSERNADVYANKNTQSCTKHTIGERTQYYIMYN